jgi:hypothetical protein
MFRFSTTSKTDPDVEKVMEIMSLSTCDWKEELNVDRVTVRLTLNMKIVC